MITLAQVLEFWTSPNDAKSEERCIGFILKIGTEGFEPDVSEQLAAAVELWAYSEPGVQAGEYASLVKFHLGI